MRIFLVLLSLFFIVVCSHAGPDSASASEDPCQTHFSNGQYDKTVECLNDQLYRMAETDTAGLLDIYKMLGVSYAMQDKKRLAKSAFDKLVNLDPLYELDPNVYLPDIIALFQMARKEKQMQLAIIRQNLYKPYTPALNFLPLGGPQLLNRQYKKAAIHFALQAVSLGVSYYGYKKRRGLYSDDYIYAEEDVNDAGQYGKIQTGGFVILTCAYVWGLLDGFLNRPKPLDKGTKQWSR